MELGCIFTDNMVLQANRPIRIFGTGKGTAYLTFHGVEKKIVSNLETWQVEFEPMGYGGPYEMEFVFDNKAIRIKNIMIGEVILCAGQSNIAFTMQEDESKTLITEHLQIRTIVIEGTEKKNGLITTDGWVPAVIDTIPYWSAIGYYVARELHKKGIAVGIIGCYKGRSVIKSWLPKASTEQRELWVPMIYPIDVLEKDYAKYYTDHYTGYNSANYLYNRTIAKIIPYSIGNVIWYQGESDTRVAEGRIYQKLLTELIRAWREVFNYPELPFVIVQICDYDIRREYEPWGFVQKEQESVCKQVPNAVLVKSNLYCESDKIHPSKKYDLAMHILNALKLVTEKIEM